MIYFRKHSFWLSFVLLLTVGCGDTALTDSQLQSTVDAAVQATTNALNPPTATPEPLPSATSDPASNAETTTAPVEESEPPTSTPIPTATDIPTPVPTATPEGPFVRIEQDGGTIRYELPLERFGITLPNNWIVADLSLSAEEFAGSQIKEVLGSQLFQALIESGVKFYAINLSEPSNASVSPANINIAAQNRSDVSTLDEFTALTLEQLVYEFGLEEEEITQSIVTVSDLPAQRLDYLWQIKTPKGDELTLQVVKYIVVANETIYNIVVTIPADLAPSLLPAAESAIQEMTFYTE